MDKFTFESKEWACDHVTEDVLIIYFYDPSDDWMGMTIAEEDGDICSIDIRSPEKAREIAQYLLESANAMEKARQAK